MSSQHEPTKRRLTSHPDPSVSIVIPAKNAGEEFALTLEVIRSQADIEAEIIVVDSGSTDATVELARRFGANVFEVAAESFDHGRTRNLGLSQASGEFCVLLSQDAVPVGETWLSTLLEPFSDDQVVGISACMVPREDADPMGRWETESHRELMGNFVQKYRLQSGDCFSSLIREERLRVTCFNNVCSALRRDVWEKIPFRPGSFAEDMDWRCEPSPRVTESLQPARPSGPLSQPPAKLSSAETLHFEQDCSSSHSLGPAQSGHPRRPRACLFDPLSAGGSGLSAKRAGGQFSAD